MPAGHFECCPFCQESWLLTQMQMFGMPQYAARCCSSIELHKVRVLELVRMTELSTG